MSPSRIYTNTIKRALNQDKKAIDKLCSLFQGIAEAVKMAKKRGLKRYTDDIKQEARILLWSMIKGFSPKQILDGLTHNVNFSIPKSVETFYLYWLSQEVPKRLNEYPLIDPFDVLVLLNPASPIASEIKWKLPKTLSICLTASHSGQAGKLISMPGCSGQNKAVICKAGFVRGLANTSISIQPIDHIRAIRRIRKITKIKYGRLRSTTRRSIPRKKSQDMMTVTTIPTTMKTIPVRAILTSRDGQKGWMSTNRRL
ncbi:MAG: hypothetical protein DYG83_17550 [Candidatus Brocadia sp. AMX2]|nr:hypothetical protein [Candidatus Brocadia sp.]MBL1170334.1 hypothetical protein [Candidatus Brocadia sp. AMX1]MCE7868579.1 hypothetical protein [Candidatus Brocadia sp. AMX2]MCQ3919150.1 hypothetical protein [Candidatus Brocadia sp.]